jgi:hypothetical protein
MKKPRKKKGDMGYGLYRPPTPKQMVKMQAEGIARTAIEAHPKVKKMQDEITRAVEGAVAKHLGGGKRTDADA